MSAVYQRFSLRRFLHLISSRSIKSKIQATTPHPFPFAKGLHRTIIEFLGTQDMHESNIPLKVLDPEPDFFGTMDFVLL